MTEVIKKESVLPSCVGGAGTIALQHLLCPGHGTIALSAKVLIGTGAVTSQSLEGLTESVEHAATGGLEYLGMSAPGAHQLYHATTEIGLPVLGYGLLAHSAYVLAQRALSRRRKQSCPARPIESEDVPVEFRPEAYRSLEQYL